MHTRQAPTLARHVMTQTFYLGSHHCYLRQLDDVGAHCVEDVLELVDHGDKSLHGRGLRAKRGETRTEALSRDGPKVIQCPADATIAATPNSNDGSSSVLGDVVF